MSADEDPSGTEIVDAQTTTEDSPRQTVQESEPVSDEPDVILLRLFSSGFTELFTNVEATDFYATAADFAACDGPLVCERRADALEPHVRSLLNSIDESLEVLPAAHTSPEFDAFIHQLRDALEEQRANVDAVRRAAETLDPLAAAAALEKFVEGSSSAEELLATASAFFRSRHAERDADHTFIERLGRLAGELNWNPESVDFVTAYLSVGRCQTDIECSRAFGVLYDASVDFEAALTRTIAEAEALVPDDDTDARAKAGLLDILETQRRAMLLFIEGIDLLDSYTISLAEAELFSAEQKRAEVAAFLLDAYQP